MLSTMKILKLLLILSYKKLKLIYLYNFIMNILVIYYYIISKFLYRIHTCFIVLGLNRF
jgi:hypothetical protein